MKTQNKALSLSAGIVGGYGLLKIQNNKIDAYTRSTIGVSVGFILTIAGLVKRSNIMIFGGLGLIAGGLLTLEEVKRLQGAKIVSNESEKPVYIYKEDSGIIELKPKEIPEYRVDGLTLKGYNAVFKGYDGVYVKILKDGTITETFGIGKLVNQFGAGKLDKLFCETEKLNGNTHWLELYNKSV